MTLREALRDNAYRACLVGGFANGWSSFGVRVAVLPLFAVTVLGAEPWVAGTALAVFAGGNALVLPFSGRRSDTMGRRPLILTGLAVNAVATGALGFSSSIPVFFALSLAAGAGAGLVNPVQQAAVADIIGRERSAGRVLAIFQMAQDLGTIIGPVLAGVLADQVSYQAAFLVTGMVTVVAWVIWLGARETHHPELSSPDDPDCWRSRAPRT